MKLGEVVVPISVSTLESANTLALCQSKAMLPNAKHSQLVKSSYFCTLSTIPRQNCVLCSCIKPNTI